MTGALTLWASPLLRAAQQASAAAGAKNVAGRVSVIDVGTNVVVISSGDAFLLVDSGTPNSVAKLTAALKGISSNLKVTTVFNTHYHLDQTGNNELFSAAGATIIAHDRTRQMMANEYWIPEEVRYEKPRPRGAWPTQTFFNKETLKAGDEQIEYGYLLDAHTGGDLYVFFKNANVLAVGDVASPVKDPELDWITGAWIGARVTAMDLLLKISNERTQFIPGTGPVMTQSEFKAERELMEIVRQRLFKQTRAGDGPKDMLEAGVLNGLSRTWKDPYKFIYAAAKGTWGNNNKLDPDVV
jgi:glyoxylase-like metal-dependent hydrolase (beta-lactamase superfamily II)